ncbi:MAG: DNA mismatch repair protein MutS [Eubacteriales bacterium]|nr:DNA mismatch repair protein MutS [Eubacteriales bacterium]
MADKHTEEKLSPMMAHYLETKKQHPDCILFYRLGDFYEMFFEDAKTAAEELELVLTGKDCGLSERAPMCGIPYHAAENYITRLVKKGYKVAIAEQVEDPKQAKGLVKREVIRIVTPGTITADEALEEAKNNYLMAIAYVCNTFGISTLDISTGDFYLTQVSELKDLYDEISRFAPSEIICNDEFLFSGADIDGIKYRFHIVLNPAPRHYFDEAQDRKLLKEHFRADLSGLGLSDYFAGVIAAGAALRYVYDTQFSTVSHITDIKPYQVGEYMILDSSTVRNLELLETLREKEKRGSLLWVLDKTKTAMGARLMRSIIMEPLLSRAAILKRQDAVAELSERFIDREEIIEYLRPVYDLERLLSRISTQSANPRDLLAFLQSIQMTPAVKTALGTFEAPLLKEIREGLDELPELSDLISRAINEDAPVSVRDGGMIKRGYSEEADRLFAAKTEGKDWLLKLEQEEREQTGIRTLKIKFNKVFGYCIEVSNSFKNSVPDYYIRKQTLSTGERYTTDRLEELAQTILGAEEKLKALEYDLFCGVRDRIGEEAARIHRLSKSLALLDVICSLSVVALRNNYVKPSIGEKGVIDIKDGRHPVVELMISEGQFVANDTLLNDDKDRISIITGPNMAGKSTYMRQVALIVLMAQIGSFVPAKSANICICDRIFTRVGASDDLASGQSTFMVEMTEVANILRNATKDSLLILDEIGRGTSTFDGLSIAWSVVEYIADRGMIGAKTLFATHYHELTELEGKIDGVHNYCIAVKENDDDLVFLRKIIPGGADKSYGIAVAKLAGVPLPVIGRANEIADELSDADITKAAAKLGTKKAGEASGKLRVNLSKDEFKKQQEVISALSKKDVQGLTPIEALLFINELQEKLKES